MNGWAEEAARQTTEASTEPETEETEPLEEAYVPPIDFEALTAENPDTIGWIRIPDTNVDYPIVQGTDNDFYLDHDFYGKESAAGSIYLDFESEADLQGRNQILYGHNMKNGACLRISTATRIRSILRSISISASTRRSVRSA